jgi:pimeloyl-ACP methyl ester carboxylesterase
MSSMPPPTGFRLRDVATPDCPSIALWEREGAGPPIACIHGNTSSKDAFAALLVEPALAGRHLVALDLPGAGESADMADPHRYTIPIVASTMTAALAAAGLDRPILLGWSLGGHIAIEMAGQGAPLAALVLTGTPPAGPGADEIANAFHPSEELGVGLSESPPREALMGYIAQVYGLEPPLPEHLVTAGFRFDGRFRARFAEHWLAGESGHSQKAVIAGWPAPIAVIQGDREPFFDAASVNSLSWNRLWRGESQMIADAGHAPFLTHPAAYAALLAAFADTVTA